MIKDVGPLDWRVSIVDKQGRPSPEFQRQWNSNRNNTAQIGSVTFGSGAPISANPKDGALYIDVSNLFQLYVADNGAWNQSGVAKFLDLSDAPKSYAAHGGDLVTVKQDESGLEFTTPPVIPVAADPTAIAGPVAVPGQATTFMRSDAAPEVQLASVTRRGLVQPDGTTITVDGNGVISAAAGGGSSVGGVLPLATGDLPMTLISDAHGQPIGVPL